MNDKSSFAAGQRVTSRPASWAAGDKFILALGAVALAGMSAIQFVRYARSLGAPLYDWTFYAGAVQRWLAGEAIYPGARISTLGADAGSSYAYPPASVPLMLPFASWPIGAVLWELVVVGLLLAGMWAVVRVGWPAHPLRAMGVALLALAAFPPALEGIAVGNVNIATAGALGLAWAGSRFTSPLAGWLTVVKVFPLALAATAGLRSMLMAALIAAGIVLVTLPLVGVPSWVDYASGLGAAEPMCGSAQWFNPSLACAVAPAIGLAAAKWAGLVVAGLCLVVAVIAGRTLVGVVAAAGAVIAPATELHSHYLTLLFVLALIALASDRVRRRPAFESSGNTKPVEDR